MTLPLNNQIMMSLCYLILLQLVSFSVFLLFYVPFAAITPFSLDLTASLPKVTKLCSFFCELIKKLECVELALIIFLGASKFRGYL